MVYLAEMCHANVFDDSNAILIREGIYSRMKKEIKSGDQTMTCTE